MRRRKADDTPEVQEPSYDPRYEAPDWGARPAGAGRGAAQRDGYAGRGEWADTNYEAVAARADQRAAAPQNYYQRMKNAQRPPQEPYDDDYTAYLGQDGGYADAPYRQGATDRYADGPYRQRTERGYADAPYRQRATDRYADESDYDYEDDLDEGYVGGDDYDFGRARKKRPKKRRAQDAYDDRDDRRAGRGRRDDGRHEKPRRRRHPVRRFFGRLLLVLVLICGLFVFLVHMAFRGVKRVDPVADRAADSAAGAVGAQPYKEPGVMNILLIGQDARDGETQTRSDSMIIASLNPRAHKVVLTSLMRDMYVPIPDYGSNKMNAAYAFGGMETLDRTVQEDFGIDINGNLVVDFNGFLAALASVGDIKIELTQEEADYMNQNPALGENNDYYEGPTWNLTAGENTLNAKQALAYSRMRYVGNSDWDRVNRQKKLLEAAVKKLRTNPFKLLPAVTGAAPSLTTDMTDLYLTKAALFGLLSMGNIEMHTIPGDGMYSAENIDGMDTLVPDMDACRAQLMSDIYGK